MLLDEVHVLRLISSSSTSKQVIKQLHNILECIPAAQRSAQKDSATNMLW
jgi:hypothetical protein